MIRWQWMDPTKWIFISMTQIWIWQSKLSAAMWSGLNCWYLEREGASVFNEWQTGSNIIRMDIHLRMSECQWCLPQMSVCSISCYQTSRERHPVFRIVIFIRDEKSIHGTFCWVSWQQIFLRNLSGLTRTRKQEAGHLLDEVTEVTTERKTQKKKLE